MTQQGFHTDPKIERMRGNIGGHDMAAILNVHPYITALQCYWRLRGELPPAEPSKNMFYGRMVEPVILNMYQHTTGYKLRKYRKNQKMAGQEYLVARPDALCLGEKRIVDAKSVHFSQKPLFGEPGTSEVPEYLLTQVQHYMAVLPNIECTDLAVWFGGSDFAIYTVYPDYDLQDLIVNTAADFRQNVLDGIQPDADYQHPYLQKALQRRFRGTTGECVTLSQDLAVYYDTLVLEQEKKRDAEKVIAECKNRIAHAMRDASAAEFEHIRDTWAVRSHRSRGSYTTKPWEGIVLSFTHKRPRLPQYMPPELQPQPILQDEHEPTTEK